MRLYVDYAKLLQTIAALKENIRQEQLSQEILLKVMKNYHLTDTIISTSIDNP